MGTPLLAQPDEAWVSLFNAKDLEGWSLVDPPIEAEVRDSCIELRMTPHTSRHAFLKYDGDFEDFIFEIEYRRDQQMDSGIIFRGQSAPETAYSALFGYMMKIDPRPARRWTGGVFLDFGNGWNWLHALEGDERARSAEKGEGEWNRVRIEAIGETIKVWLNDVPTVHMRDNRYTSGCIALKVHYLRSGDPEKANLRLAFRNVRIITENLERHTRKIDIALLDTREDTEVTFFR